MRRYLELTKRHISYLKTLGIDVDSLFKSIKIPKLVDGRSISINELQYFEIAKNVDKVISDDIILQYGNIDGITQFIPTLFAVMCANNGINCFERLSKYKKIIGPYTLDVEKTDKYINLRITFDYDDFKIPRYLILSEQVIIVGIIRKATGKHIIPVKVTSIYDYRSDQFENYFGVKAVKSFENIVSFNRCDMEESFVTENNIMWEYLQPELRRRVEELEKDNSYRGQVQTVLFELIPGGRGTIEDVSKQLDVSSRTLQRKLATEKTTFIKQLNHIREVMAKNHLKTSSMTNEEIALLIGYSEANVFSRAFKRWTGLTPSQYRKAKNPLYIIE